MEETIEKCYHPMERLCAPPAYGEEPAEVFKFIVIKNTHDILVHKMYKCTESDLGFLMILNMLVSRV